MIVILSILLPLLLIRGLVGWVTLVVPVSLLPSPRLASVLSLALGKLVLVGVRPIDPGFNVKSSIKFSCWG